MMPTRKPRPGQPPAKKPKPRKPSIKAITDRGDPQQWADRLHPQRFPGMSMKMAAIVGHLTDRRYTTPHLVNLETTSDGIVMGQAEGDSGNNHYVGHISDLHQNWAGLLDAASLSPQERAQANATFARKLRISVSPMRRGLPESAPQASNLTERFDSTHRGWIAPDGAEHPFGDFLETHASWAGKHRDLVQRHHTEQVPEHMRGMNLFDWMLERGWTRKVHSNQYHVHDHSMVPSVIEHVRRRHPEVKQVDVIVGGLGADRMYKLPTSGDPRRWSANTMQRHAYGDDEETPDEYNVRQESIADGLISEALIRRGDRTRTYTSSSDQVVRSSRRAAARAWIDPAGKVYPLRGVFQKTGTTWHPEWVEKHQDLVSKHLIHTGGLLSKRKLDRHATMVHMMRHGWIRKASKTVYETGSKHLHKVAHHFRTHHPDEPMARVRVHESNGDTHDYIVRHDRIEAR